MSRYVDAQLKLRFDSEYELLEALDGYISDDETIVIDPNRLLEEFSQCLEEVTEDNAGYTASDPFEILEEIICDYRGREVVVIDTFNITGINWDVEYDEY